MRFALALGFVLTLSQVALAQGAPQDNGVALPPAGAVSPVAPVQPGNPLKSVLTPPAAPSVKPQVLSPADVALYRQIFAAERSGDIRDQTRQALEKLDKVLADAGTDKSRLLSAQIWLKDIARDFAGQGRPGT